MQYTILCIGNKDGGDDGIGPYIADHLKPNNQLTIINSGTIPENYTSLIKQHKPDHLIIIDAVDMHLPAGEIRIRQKNKISELCISTHGIPLSLLINYLQQTIKTITLIGIQPKTMTGPLSNEIKHSGEYLIKILQTQNLSELKTLP